MKKITNIIINGRTKPFRDSRITLEDLCLLAFGSYEEHPNRVFTATYAKGPDSNKSGSITNNITPVNIVEEMVFNVIATDKA